MSKDFTDVAFSPVEFKKELDRFRDLLNAKKIVGERELQALFKASWHLTAYIGTTFGNIGVARQVAYEFEIMGDYRADIVVGNPEKQFCFVELEIADPDAVLASRGESDEVVVKTLRARLQPDCGLVLSPGRFQEDGPVPQELRLRPHRLRGAVADRPQ